MADLERPETLPAALDGAGMMFLYAELDGIEGLLATAESAGGRHVVLLADQAGDFRRARHPAWYRKYIY